jgi:DNA-binding LytR/AlgR family response regulator
MLHAIAIDDEPMALEVIKAHAAKVPFLDLNKVFTDAILALEYIRSEQVDLIFLDIKMPDISGMELATLIPKDTMVIFTTAYSEHAVKSFELDAMDYLLKPFNLGRFLKACQKAQEWHDLKKGNAAGTVFVKTGYEQVKVNFDDLLFCEANGNYVNFQLPKDKILSRMTLAEVEKILPSNFVKSHRSFLVNIQHVQKIERHQLTVGDKLVPISVSYQEGLMEKVREVRK